MQNITKIYSNGFVANKNITFSVEEGEIHALVGENGAGKTTLMKILFGMENAQEGETFIHGQKAKITCPLDAINLGVGMVHQHFMLVPSLTVAENVVLGIEPVKKGFFDIDKAVNTTQELADKYNFHLNAKSRVSDLSVGLMQKVEILKALIKGAKVLILDEPTAVLTPQETVELFEQLKLLKENGHSIIFISHKLEEVMQLCDRVTILRHGYSQCTYSISELDEAKISRMMVGRDVVLKIEKDAPKCGEAIVKIKNLVKVNSDGKNAIDDISFEIHEGEVVGIAGVEGNGQSELSDAISGMQPYNSGSITINGEEIREKSIRNIRRLGLSFIPEDRMAVGCVSDMSIGKNICADRFRNKENMQGHIFINGKRLGQIADDAIRNFEVSCDDKKEPIRFLSGGNIQKVVVAREFTTGGNFILADQPTRGVDVGTAELIRNNLVHKVRNDHMGSLLISADLNEVMEVSDRLLVMRQGKIVAAFPQANLVNEEELGEYMLGIKCMTAEEMVGVL